MDSGHKNVSAAIVSGCNTSPVFQLYKHVFDQRVLLIQMEGSKNPLALKCPM